MKALILCVGGLRGAYDAGVAAALCQKLGNKYFDAIYMSSVGVYAGTFYAANQPDIIENTWRNYVCGNQFVNFLNPIKGRNILDIEYLIDIFKTEKSYLDIDEIINSGVKLNYVVENLRTGKVEYLQPTKENVFELLRAGSAVPIIHGPVKLNNEMYIDGALVDPLPVKKAIEDGYKEIVVVYNKPKGFRLGIINKFNLWILSIFMPPLIGKQTRALGNLLQSVEKTIAENKDILIIRPDLKVDFSILNTNKKVINKIFDAGLSDGYKAAEKLLENKPL